MTPADGYLAALTATLTASMASAAATAEGISLPLAGAFTVGSALVGAGVTWGMLTKAAEGRDREVKEVKATLARLTAGQEAIVRELADLKGYLRGKGTIE